MIRRRIVAAGLSILLVTAAFAAPSAIELLKSGRPDAAIDLAKNRVQTNPRDAEAYYILSRAYFQLERWDDAISNGERAIELQPNVSEYHMWLGRAYGEKADASNFLVAAQLAGKLRDQMEKAVELDPSNAAARADLAEFYVDAPGFIGGGKDKARAQAKLLEKNNPVMAHWILAAVASKDKKYDVAEQELKAALQAGNYSPKEWLDLASFYRRRKRLDDMQEAVKKAVAEVGPGSRFLYEGAEILYRGGRNLAGAEQMLRKYIATGSGDGEAPMFQAHYLLGQILEKLGKKQEAAEQYRASLSEASAFQKAQSALKRLQRD